MTKRERKYHQRKNYRKTIIDLFAANISETIDDEIMQILRKIASGETEAPKEILLSNKKIK